MDVTHFPALNACLNFLSALFLMGGYVAIRKGRIILHRTCMGFALLSSIVFLGCYLTYHYQVGSVKFTGTGWIRTVYFAILLTHTVLATAIIPFVLRTVYLAIRSRFESHRKWARWTWPLWMYVSVTGVVIYWMLYQL